MFTFTVINWTARRAGGRITINGVDAKDGQPLKIVGIDMIRPELNAETGITSIVATRHDGKKYKLTA